MARAVWGSASRAMSRPSKLTPAVHDRLVSAVSTGVTLRVAAQSVGVDPDTVTRWRNAGRQACDAAGLDTNAVLGDEDLLALLGVERFAVVKLYQALHRAEARPAIVATASIMQALDRGDWRAAQHWLHQSGRLRAWRAQPPGSRPAPSQDHPQDHRRTSAGGRPTKLTDAVHEQLVTLLGAGMFACDAAAVVGISASTYHRWMRHGEALLDEATRRLQARDHDDDWLCADLSDDDLAEVLDADDLRLARLFRDVSDAQATVAMRAKDVWYQAARRDWRAAAAFLDEYYPERWASDPLRREAPPPLPALPTDPAASAAPPPILSADEAKSALLRVLQEAGVLPTDDA